MPDKGFFSLFPLLLILTCVWSVLKKSPMHPTIAGGRPHLPFELWTFLSVVVLSHISFCVRRDNYNNNLHLHPTSTTAFREIHYFVLHCKCIDHTVMVTPRPVVSVWHLFFLVDSYFCKFVTWSLPLSICLPESYRAIEFTIFLISNAVTREHCNMRSNRKQTDIRCVCNIFSRVWIPIGVAKAYRSPLCLILTNTSPLIVLTTHSNVFKDILNVIWKGILWPSSSNIAFHVGSIYLRKL